jgi:hypothetical protein
VIGDPAKLRGEAKLIQRDFRIPCRPEAEREAALGFIDLPVGLRSGAA